ncbi:hypothetical protein [Roseateles sp.]|uniref:hypothetical protein n=1 Tax=Roseateles sp. TaxID=1971397 RepID=UPI0025CF577E|nr:hypothetical protein [Roseateles sp.]MBV8034164.1 hypothetical protein [Roseateles sp.]
MRRVSPALAPLGLLLLGPPVLAQLAPDAAPPAVRPEACQAAPPQIPVVDWRGIAAYRARYTVKDGRMVQLEVTPLTGGVERRAQRGLVMSIQLMLRDAKCPPGDHVFEEDFSFDLRQGTASAPAGGSSSPQPATP